MSYTYRIGWSKLGMWYYGVRYAKGCKPGDMFTTYFTSSKEVKKFVKLNGIPDTIQIRRTFTTKEAALNWEHKVLKRMNVINRNDYLNKTDNKAINLSRDDYTKIAKKISIALKGKPKSKESIEKMKETKRNNPYKHTDEAKFKISHASSNRSEKTLQLKSDTMRKKKWANDGHVNKRFEIIPDGWNLGRLNLQRSPMSNEAKESFRLKRCAKTGVIFRGESYLSLRHAEEQTGISRHLIKKEICS